jgi:hypothetical protein
LALGLEFEKIKPIIGLIQEAVINSILADQAVQRRSRKIMRYLS